MQILSFVYRKACLLVVLWQPQIAGCLLVGFPPVLAAAKGTDCSAHFQSINLKCSASRSGAGSVKCYSAAVDPAVIGIDYTSAAPITDCAFC